MVEHNVTVLQHMTNTWPNPGSSPCHPSMLRNSQSLHCVSILPIPQTHTVSLGPELTRWLKPAKPTRLKSGECEDACIGHSFALSLLLKDKLLQRLNSTFDCSIQGHVVHPRLVGPMKPCCASPYNQNTCGTYIGHPRIICCMAT